MSQEFEVHSLNVKQSVPVSVKSFADTFGDRDMSKVVGKYSRETMYLPSDVLLRMAEAPQRPTPQKKSSWEILFLFLGIVAGVIFAPVLTENARLFGLGVLAVGVCVGAVIGMNWKKIEHSFVEAQKSFWDSKFDNLDS